MTGKVDHSGTLRSYSFLGGATFINMLVSLVRVKAIALLLGPAGVGLMGLLLNIMSTASTLIGLGVGSSGTREIAEQVGRSDQEKVDTARRALFWGTMLLALFGGISIFLLRHVLAAEILHDPGLSSSVGWLSVGVVLTIAASSQSALITGMRRVGEIAKIQVISQLSATAIGLGVISYYGIGGLVFHVIAFPLMAFIVSHLYVAKLPEIKSAPSGIRELSEQLSGLIRLGMAFMLANFVTVGGQLIVCTLIQKELGIVSLGYFQASWGLSMVYLSFILAVLGTDYYPKLAGIMHRRNEANALINQQTEVAILMAAPLTLFLLGTLPWVIRILYSPEFIPATDILRWLVYADVLKIASAPLRLVILASGRGRLFLLSEALGMGVFIVSAWIFLPIYGVEGAGIGYFVMYSLYLPLVYYLAKKQVGFSWNKRVKNTILGLAALVSTSILVGNYGEIAELAASIVFAISCFIYTLVFMYRSAGSSRPKNFVNKFVELVFPRRIKSKIKSSIRWISLYLLRFTLRVRSPVADPSFGDLLVLAPHPDDEIIGIGGCVMASVCDGKSVHIVFLTDGESSCPEENPEDVKEQRRHLTLKAAEQAGIPRQNIHRIGLPDGAVPRRGEPGYEIAVMEIKGLIEKIRPDSVMATHIMDVWPHDHVACAQMSEDAVSLCNQKPELYWYWVWAWHNQRPWRLWLNWPKQMFAVDIRPWVSRKLELVSIYLDPKAPGGAPWSGSLPETLRRASRFEIEVLEKRLAGP